MYWCGPPCLVHTHTRVGNLMVRTWGRNPGGFQEYFQVPMAIIGNLIFFKY